MNIADAQTPNSATTDAPQNSESCNLSSESKPSSSGQAANSEFCILNSEFKTFPRSSGESLRAYNAFITFFQLGHNRTRQTVADKLHESIDSIKKWSAKFDWSERIIAFDSGLLQQRAKAEAEADQQQTAERSALMSQFRRREWAAATKMLSTVEFYLENCEEQQLENMTLGQVAQALSASSAIGRLAMSGSDLPEDADSAKSSILAHFKDSLKRAYGKEAAPEPKNAIQSNSNPPHGQN